MPNIDELVVKVTADTADLQRGMRDASGALDQFKRSSDESTRSTEAATRELDKLLARYDPQIRAQQQLARLYAEASRVQAAGGTISQQQASAIERVNGRLGEANQMTQQAAQGATTFARAASTLQSELSTLSGPVAGPLSQLLTIFAPSAGIALGLTAAAAAAVFFYESIVPRAKTTEELLTEQARLLADVKAGYDSSTGAATQFYDRVIEFQAQQNAVALKERQTKEASAILGRIGQFGVETGFGGSGLGDFFASRKFSDFQKPIQEFSDSVVRGTPEVKKFREEILRLGEANPQLAARAALLIAETDEWVKLGGAVKKTADEMRRFVEEGSGAGVQSALDRLLQAAPIANAAEIRQQHILSLRKDASEAAAGGNAAEAAIAAKRLAVAIAEINTVQKEAADRYQTAAQGIRDNIEELNLQALSAGRTTEEVTRLKTAHDLLRAAMRTETGITEERRKEIDKLADSYARMTDEVQRAKLIGDINFERDQLGRSQFDQAAAVRLRGAGLPVDLDSSIAGQIRLNEQMKIGKDLATDFAGSFVRDLRRGVDGMTALGNALDRLTDRLMDMAINRLVAQAFGGLLGSGSPLSLAAPGFSGGGGGAIPGVSPTDGLSPIHHAGGVVGSPGMPMRYVHPAYFDNAPRFHSGGLVGGEVPIIAKKGEVVGWPDQMRQAFGGPRVNVNVINNAGGDVKVSEPRENADGGIDLDLVIDRKVARAINRPGTATSNSLAQRGVMAPLVRRG